MGVTRFLYRAAGALACVALAGIAALILAQIAARLMGAQIKSADDFAGWMLAASMFLALPMTLNAGDHIRVTVISESLPAGARRVLDTVVTALGVGLMLWAAWHILAYVRESWVFGDVSHGLLAVPLWIPQLSMAVGMVLLAVALVERLLRRLTGRPVPEDDRDAQGHGE
ncbi:TRAP transporter small permease [Paracoccus sanguinis]|uniref:TRAP transporter small permease protein n=1 Tax=Paracoccus sanguinis TaxID=1545044 RepID=A0A099GI90_9RHOB|nr:TRAP transporter small permease [Paracoccus sanguinis]KGJ21868.1 hypothetical protein IX56_11480 [Paracoccus sanguinis]